jgi:peptidoglycan/LPS O-acetylase OafA/YrhL
MGPFPPSADAIALARAHDPALDGLRGLSALVVLCGHAIGMVVRTDAMVISLAGQWVARAAVIFFFVLSGHVIARALIAAHAGGGVDLRHYAIARIARIYPPLLLAFVLAWAVALLVGAGLMRLPSNYDPGPLQLTFANVVADLVFLFNKTSPMQVLNGAVWSLRLEVICYIVSALAVVALTGGWPARIAAVVAAGGMMLAAWLRLDSALIAFVAFAAGAAAALLPGLVRRLPGGLLWLGVAAFGIASFVITGAIDGNYAPRGISYHGYQLTLVAACVALLVPGAGRGLFGNGLGRAIGARAHALADSAYTLFITHLPIMLLALGFVPAIYDLPWIVQGAILMAASVAFAVVAARFVEQPKPVRAWLDRHLPGSQPAARPAA